MASKYRNPHRSLFVSDADFANVREHYADTYNPCMFVVWAHPRGRRYISGPYSIKFASSLCMPGELYRVKVTFKGKEKT